MGHLKVCSMGGEAVQRVMQAISSLENFYELPDVVYSELNRLFHVDWLGLYYGSHLKEGVSVHTNSSCHFEWDTIYAKVFPDDTLLKQTMLLPTGAFFVGRDVLDFSNPRDLDHFERSVKYTDTRQFLSISGGDDGVGFSGFGLYRSEEGKPYLEDGKKVVQAVSGIIALGARYYFLQHVHDQRKLILDTLANESSTAYGVLNSNLKDIEVSETARDLFSAFESPHPKDLPVEIKQWITKVIAPSGKLIHYPAQCEQIFKTSRLSMQCKAMTLKSEDGSLALFICVNPPPNKERFVRLSSSGLTPREIETLEYLPLGYTNR